MKQASRAHPKLLQFEDLLGEQGGILAAWCYQLHTVSPEVDAVIRRLYADILGSYWPPERRLVEQGYRTLPFPFEEIEPPRSR